MEPQVTDSVDLGHGSKQVVRRLLAIGDNRLELLCVEVHEERRHLLRTFFLAVGAATFGLLASLTLTTAIIVMCWHSAPILTPLILTAVYAAAGGCIFWRLVSRERQWKTLPATLDQIRKDRMCLEKILS